MPEWHKGPVGPDKRHRKLAQMPTDMPVGRATPGIAAIPVTTLHATPTPTDTPPPPLTRTDLDTLYKAGIRGLREVYLPSSPPETDEGDNSRSTTPTPEPPPDPSAHALRALLTAQARLVEAQADLAAAVEAVHQASITPGKPNSPAT